MYKKLIINLFVFTFIIVQSIFNININMEKQKNYVGSINTELEKLGYIQNDSLNNKTSLWYKKDDNRIHLDYSINKIKNLSVTVNVLNETEISEIMEIVKIFYNDNDCLNWISDNLSQNMQQLVLTNEKQDSRLLTSDFYYFVSTEFNDKSNIEVYISITLFTK